jgi:hypothetical protein
MTTNQKTVLGTCTQRQLALNKHGKAKTPMSINGEQLKLADVIGIYQASLDILAEVSTKRAELETALTNRATIEAKRRATDTGLRAWVTGEFGPDSQQARDFGFLPKKTTAKTAETKHTAVLKMKATRDARHTMGKKQKQKIKGTIVAPAAPAAPAPTAQQASPGASAPTPANGASSPAPIQNGLSPAH